MEDGIYIYTVRFSEPCIKLKEWFSKKKIDYNEIFIESLRGIELENFKKNVIKASVLNHATPPAVLIIIKGKKHWISNSGRPISKMIKKIENKIKGLT